MLLILIYLKLVISKSQRKQMMLKLSLIKVNRLNYKFLFKIKLKLYKIVVNLVYYFIRAIYFKTNSFSFSFFKTAAIILERHSEFLIVEDVLTQ